jgi:glyoxylase-like metal-dependent hydrolase (beta-lactamase superfamily II)
MSHHTPQLSAQFTIGSVRVAVLSDGVPMRDLGNFFLGIDREVWGKELGLADPNELLPFNFGAFLVQDGQRNILIDSGMGPGVFDEGTPGKDGLLDRLAELDVRGADVDLLFHTHLHRDHVGWSVTGEPGQEVEHFPNATVVVSQREIDYWFHPAVIGTERGQTAFRGLSRAMDAGRVVTFDGEYEVTPGLTTIPTPGHTPGHNSVMITSQDEHLLILGDLTHHKSMLEHHDWVAGVDVDPSETTRSRKKICEVALEHDALVTAPHFDIPTLGRIRRVDEGYRFEEIDS